MQFHFLRPRGYRSSPTTAKTPLFFRPRLEGYEERLVPNAAMGAAILAPASIASSAVLSMQISDVQVVSGLLVATGHVGEDDDTSFTTALTLTTSPPVMAGGVPTVHIVVGATGVALRGLTVDTSAIGLTITPTPGTTGSFGSVLANVATELNAGMSLQTVIGGLNANDLATLEAGLQASINGALIDLTADSAVSAASGRPGKFGVLDLSFGPAILTVDGQTLAVDNGAGGPATATIIAGGGRGHLLDNLFHKLGIALQDGDQGRTQLLLARIAQRIELIEG
jgi:hypothetical protein